MTIERIVDYDISGNPITARMAGWPEGWWYMSDEEAEAERKCEQENLDGFLVSVIAGL